MTKRHPEEVVLGRWTVSPEALRDFIARVRAHHAQSPFPPRDLLEACEKQARTGLEVVCREDAIFVGSWCLSFLYNGVSKVRLEEHWMECVMDGGAYYLQIPLPLPDRTEPARMVEVYARQQAEEWRRYIEERSAPTLNNRLLTFTEKHFVWVLVGLFFVAIPAAVVVFGLLRGSFR